ncbi:hypothetical protein O6U65_1732 [Saccharomyces cerevisiae synthetic construct]|uniref:Putative uncharacterized protein YLR171W n=1 Tax=Saccharomyces cerevisiae (strain ATCC 204508 / S288c) TaxID=559292 RepID=YL171_YEAST|nr:RecName: Full=Putative uncharacterized protein YLR171W [Saccharomyces cerevisiae S288C]AAB67478.1 Ylr171wp [Saccharomyces cerevisiae]WNV72872.1 hypothetical protein O6U65_1732 [Saccharomyces cerevisiae synthetic construct]
MSSSQTLPKYVSIVSTNRWIISKVSSSLSTSGVIPTIKYRLAYRLYTTLWSLYSMMLHILGFLANIVGVKSFTIFAFSPADIAVYHFFNLIFPCLETSNKYFNCVILCTCVSVYNLLQDRSCSWLKLLL